MTERNIAGNPPVLSLADLSVCKVYHITQHLASVHPSGCLLARVAQIEATGPGGPILDLWTP